MPCYGNSWNSGNCYNPQNSCYYPNPQYLCQPQQPCRQTVFRASSNVNVSLTGNAFQNGLQQLIDGLSASSAGRGMTCVDNTTIRITVLY